VKQYLVTYDLLGKPYISDYKSLFDALTAMNAKRVLLSVWMFKRSNTTCAAIRDDLAAHLHGLTDRLLVTEITDWAGEWLVDDPNNF
jgi:hypothetical protein